MATKLRVQKLSNGEPAVRCPRCDETVQPDKSPLFDGYDCPECGQVIDEKELKFYLEALEIFESEFE